MPLTIRTSFFQTLFEAENYPNVDHTLYTGDWNISLYQQIDTYGYLHENNTNNRDYVKQQMIEYELNNLWRSRNPFETNFTFMKKQARNTTKTRLDFLLKSQKIKVCNSDNLFNVLSPSFLNFHFILKSLTIYWCIFYLPTLFPIVIFYILLAHLTFSAFSGTVKPLFCEHFGQSKKQFV